VGDKTDDAMKNEPSITWEPEAEKALARAPFFVRALVRKKVEERVVSAGGSVVTLAAFREAESRHRSVMAGKSEAEIEKMFPRPNTADVEMVVVEVCHNELSGCPNPLLKTDQWQEAVTGWIKERDISERLRGRVTADTIKFHHKLRIAIAGCGNGCSRPQIADLALVGAVRPDFDPAECESCGNCAAVCPDEAITENGGPPWFNLERCQGCRQCSLACARGCITLSPPLARVLAGGKLGRHPRLAQVVAEAATPAEAIGIIDPIVADYITNAKENERFADYWSRARGKN
jgi:anaerobic sulfite reductase subunit C